MGSGLYRGSRGTNRSSPLPSSLCFRSSAFPRSFGVPCQGSGSRKGPSSVVPRYDGAGVVAEDELFGIGVDFVELDFADRIERVAEVVHFSIKQSPGIFSLENTAHPQADDKIPEGFTRWGRRFWLGDSGC